MQDYRELSSLAIRQAQSEQPGRSVSRSEAKVLLHSVRKGTGTAQMEKLRGTGELQHGHGCGLHVREEILRREKQKRRKRRYFLTFVSKHSTIFRIQFLVRVVDIGHDSRDTTIVQGASESNNLDRRRNERIGYGESERDAVEDRLSRFHSTT